MNKAATAFTIAALGLAQVPDAGARAEFEVAAIRPAKDDGSHDSSTDRGRFRVHNLTLKRLIARAYDLDEGLISGGPKWVDADGFDINAKIPEEFAQQREQLPPMLQSLLSGRFKLALHREPRHVSGFILAVAKSGPKMARANPADKGQNSQSNATHLRAKNVTMEAFAKILSRNGEIGKLVVDKTGLSGGFNFELDWMPSRPGSRQETGSDDRPSIFAALQGQLGLKLESAKIPVSAIVIDSAEKPGEN